MNGQLRCAPHCKSPEKRDFMDVSPEKSESDFFRSYDPMVGIGTAAILVLFIFLITIKSFVKWIIRKIQILRYKHFNKETTAIITSTSIDNGHINS